MVGEVFDPRREARPNPQSNKCAWMYTSGSIKLFDHGVLVGVILTDFIGLYKFVTLRTTSSTFGANPPLPR
jgi:hypothetical protein